MEKDFMVMVLGCRGSMAVSGKDYLTFGGATSCYMVKAGEQTIFIDGGSGLYFAPSDFKEDPVIIISHLHLDHILGLGTYPRLSMEGKKTRILIPAREEDDVKKNTDMVFFPPFWPVSLSDYRGDIRFERLCFPMTIGDIRIFGMEGNHPGGCYSIRVCYKGRSLVYISDYEYSEESFQRLAGFSENTDLILYDAQYTPEEYEKKKGYGHSTAERGIELKDICKAKRMLFIHHDPMSTDEILLERERRLEREDISYARDREVIYL